MPQPSTDHVDIHAFFQQPDGYGVSKNVGRNVSALRIGVRRTQLDSVTFYDFIDSESRQRPSLA
jgi:hypothetical protein